MAEPLLWRAPTRDDIAAWAGLLAVVETVDRTGEYLGAEDLVDDFEAPGAAPASDAVLVLDRDDIVAFGWAQTRGGGERVLLWGAVHPDHRRQGIGTALLGWLERRAAALAAQRGGPVEVEVRAPDSNVGLATLASRRDLVVSRWWYQMQRRLDTPPAPARPPPDGVTVAHFSHALDEAVRVAHNDAFADHWGSDPRSAQDWAQWFTGGRHFRADLSFVALGDGPRGRPDGGRPDGGSPAGAEVVGYLLSYVFEPDAEHNGYTEGWVGQVGVRPPWRDRGLGRCLLTHALRAYQVAGLERAGLDVDTANVTGALGLYRSVGFAPIRTSVSYTRLVAP